MTIYLSIVATLILVLELIGLFWERKPKAIPHKILIDKKKDITIDLTLMYGEGNEPTAQEYAKMFPEDYFVYTEYEAYKKSKRRTNSCTQTVKGNNNIQITTIRRSDD